MNSSADAVSPASSSKHIVPPATSSVSCPPKQILPNHQEGSNQVPNSGPSSANSLRNGATLRPHSGGHGTAQAGGARVKAEVDGDESGSGDDRAKKRARQLNFGPSRTRGANPNGTGGAAGNQVIKIGGTKWSCCSL